METFQVNQISGKQFSLQNCVFFVGELESGGMYGGAGGSGNVPCASFRTEGRVTSACLWHACRAVTIGALLIGLGITMAILGNALLHIDIHSLWKKSSILLWWHVDTAVFKVLDVIGVKTTLGMIWKLYNAESFYCKTQVGSTFPLEHFNIRK